MTAPGGQPMFVESAAIAKLVGLGEGSVNESPILQVVFIGDRLGEHDPAARAQACVREREVAAAAADRPASARASCAAARSPTPADRRCRGSFRGRSRAIARWAACCRRAAVLIANGVVASVLALPATETHTSVTRFRLRGDPIQAALQVAVGALDRDAAEHRDRPRRRDRQRARARRGIAQLDHRQSRRGRAQRTLQRDRSRDDHDVEQRRQQQQQRDHEAHAPDDRARRVEHENDRRQRQARKPPGDPRSQPSPRRDCADPDRRERGRARSDGAAGARARRAAARAPRRRRRASPPRPRPRRSASVTTRCEPTGNANDR